MRTEWFKYHTRKLVPQVPVIPDWWSEYDYGPLTVVSLTELVTHCNENTHMFNDIIHELFERSALATETIEEFDIFIENYNEDDSVYFDYYGWQAGVGPHPEPSYLYQHAYMLIDAAEAKGCGSTSKLAHVDAYLSNYCAHLASGVKKKQREIEKLNQRHRECLRYSDSLLYLSEYTGEGNK